MFCALEAKISGERLQDHWASGFIFAYIFYCLQFWCFHV